MAAEPFCPYVGLQPYTEAHQKYFFGREREQRIIANNVYAAKLTVLLGPSGSGKSSLLQAGVVPHLRAGRQTAVVVFRKWQSEQYMEDLKAECLRAVSGAHGSPINVDVGLPLDDLLFAACQISGRTILLLFDQFEEFLLYYGATAANSTFDSEFARAINREEVDVRFLIALREDAFVNLTRFRARIPSLTDNTVALDFLTSAAAKDAIRKPLDVFNSTFPSEAGPVAVEEELIQDVLSEIHAGRVLLNPAGGAGHLRSSAGDGRVETPFLQLVMTKIWEEEMRRGSRVLRASTLASLGGAKKIVKTHLDGIMAGLTNRERETCAHMFQFLVTPSGTKIALSPADLASLSDRSVEEILPLLNKLSNARALYRVYPPERYEILHDVLAPAVLDWRARYVQERERAEAARRIEEERLRTAIQRRISRRLLALTITLTVVFSVAVWFAWFAWNQRQEALSRGLAASALNELQRDPERSVLLAMYGVKYRPTLQAQDALHRAIEALLVRRRLSGHAGPVNQAVFSPDERRIATAGQDRKLKVWESSGKLLMNLEHDNAVNTVAFSLDGKMLASGGRSSTIKLWDVDSGREMKTLSEHTGEVNRVAFSPDGSRLASGSGDGTLTLWNISSGSPVWTVSSNGPEILSVAISPDGKLVAEGESGGMIAVLDASSGKLISRFSAHDSDVRDVAFSPDGIQLVSAGLDRQAKLWEVTTGRNLCTLQGHTNAVLGVAFSPSGALVATASDDHTARTWNASSCKPMFEYTGHSGSVNSVAFNRTGNLLLTASADKSALVWEATPHNELLTIVGHTGPVYKAAFDSRGRVATASGDGSARIWNGESGQQQLRLDHGAPVFAVAFSKDGNRLVSGAGDGVARVWDANTGAPLLQLAGHTNVISDVAVCPDGESMATASWDGSARTWKISSGEPLLTLKAHSGEVTAVAYNPAGDRLATAGRDSTIRIWDVRTGAQLKIFDAHSGAVFGISWNPDGNRIASADANGTEKIWDVASGQLLTTYFGHTDAVQALAFAPDGARIASAGRDGTVAIRDVVSGQEDYEFHGHRGQVFSIAFRSDGLALASAGEDQTVRLYTFKLDELMALARKRVTRPLTEFECQKYLRISTCPAVP